MKRNRITSCYYRSRSNNFRNSNGICIILIRNLCVVIHFFETDNFDWSVLKELCTLINTFFASDLLVSLALIFWFINSILSICLFWVINLTDWLIKIVLLLQLHWELFLNLTLSITHFSHHLVTRLLVFQVTWLQQ